MSDKITLNETQTKKNHGESRTYNIITILKMETKQKKHNNY